MRLYVSGCSKPQTQSSLKFKQSSFIPIRKDWKIEEKQKKTKNCDSDQHTNRNDSMNNYDTNKSWHRRKQKKSIAVISNVDTLQKKLGEKYKRVVLQPLNMWIYCFIFF